MKILVLLALICPAICFSQSSEPNKSTYLLLDRSWNKPVRQVDSITAQDLNDGWFPIYTTDLDSMEYLIAKFKHIRKDGENRKFYNEADFKSDKFVFNISSAKYTYADRYDITIYSMTSIGKVAFKIADMGSSVNQAQATVDAVLAYLNRTRKYINKPLKKQIPAKFWF